MRSVDVTLLDTYGERESVEARVRELVRDPVHGVVVVGGVPHPDVTLAFT